MNASPSPQHNAETSDWENLGLPEPALKQARSLAQLLRDREKLSELGFRPARGMLLAAPHRVDTDRLIHVLAAECGLQLIEIDGDAAGPADSATPTHLLSALEQARACAPAILVVRSLEQAAPARGNELNRPYSNMAVGELRQAIDSNTSEPYVLVLGITSHVEFVDSMLLCHFTWKLEIAERTDGDPAASVRAAKSIAACPACRLAALRDERLETLTEAGLRWGDINLAADSVRSLIQLSERLRAAARGTDDPEAAAILFVDSRGVNSDRVADTLAWKSGYQYTSTSAKYLRQSYIGQSASRLRDVMGWAARHQPCVVFIDRLEDVTPSREAARTDSTADELILELLYSIESARSKSRSLIITAATRRVEAIDTAVLKRFNRIGLNAPGAADRRRLLNLLLNRRRCEDFTPATMAEELTFRLRDHTVDEICAIIQGASNDEVEDGAGKPVLQRSDLYAALPPFGTRA